MALERPRAPEPVNFDEYCDLLSSAMPRDLLEKGNSYTTRIKEDSPTNELFAHDYLGTVFEIEHRRDLTVITLGLHMLRGHMKRGERAVEDASNLIFRYDGLGSTEGEELGYFVGIEGSVRNAGEVPRAREVDDDEPEELAELIEDQQLRLVTVGSG